MAEESTRKLLKMFGVAVTDCEDALATLTAALARAEEPGGTQGLAEALEAYSTAARELSQRWAEVSRLILEYHSRAQQAVAGHLQGRGSR